MNNETDAQIFPDAEIVVPASELKWWTRPGVESIDLRPTRKGLAQRIQSAIATWKNVRPFEGEPELLPGVRAVQAPGHSPGMGTHLVSSGGKQLLISADVVNLSPHIQKNPEWQLAIDQDPQVAVETRRKIFDRAVADRLTISGTHWLLPNVGTLAKDGSTYVFLPEAGVQSHCLFWQSRKLRCWAQGGHFRHCSEPVRSLRSKRPDQHIDCDAVHDMGQASRTWDKRAGTPFVRVKRTTWPNGGLARRCPTAMLTCQE
jgi:glyoxylase-like metal-dependent hydrolase (beta-lactamase superfamily II)